MAQQRRVKPAAGVAVVGLGIGAGALGLYRGATAEPPRPPVPTWAAPATAAGLLAEGRELVRQNRLADALAKADAAARVGGLAPGGDTPDALRKDAVADGKKQVDELTAQAKVLAARGDSARAKASLDLARQVAAEVGLPTAPPAAAGAPVSAPTPAIQTVAFHPAEPVVPPPAVPAVAAPTLPPPDLKPPAIPSPLPPVPVVTPKPAAMPQTREVEKPLLPAPPALSLNPSGPSLPPAVPAAGRPTPAPGETPVTLPKLATAAVGAALAVAPAPAQDAPAKPGPSGAEVVKSMPAPAGVPKDQFDALKSEVDALKEYKKQVQDLLQGKADGTGKSVLDAGVLKRLTDLEEKLDRLDKAVEAMRQAVARMDGVRTAQSPATTPPAPTAPAPTPAAPAPRTAVRLVNDYPSELSLILNGTSHKLAQGETKVVGVPPGSFTYELIAAGATPITRTIRDDETVTLRIK